MRTVKQYFYARKVPDFISKIYFNKQNIERRKLLSTLLEENEDLMAGLKQEYREHWEGRIEQVLQDPDNEDIPRSKNAGKLLNGKLIMHNDLKIDPLSYYSFPVLKMLIKNKGVHEPQEEKIFQEVLRSLPQTSTPKTMLELGAYWSFYSMWFKQIFPNAKAYMAEPNRENLLYGKANFKINKFEGTFIHTKIGKEIVPQRNMTTVDAICTRNNIQFLDILHSDIQGFELDMLHGSHRMLSEKKVGYVFISTHSDELHYSCREVLQEKYGYLQVASADLKESYSWDGILVMKLPSYQGIEKVKISKREI
ncbi:MAG: FkbM family methyltransferase [Bacteroidota bacterium]